MRTTPRNIPRSSRASMQWSRLPTPGPVCPRISRAGFSSRSTRPRNKARGPVSASVWCSASPSSPAGLPTVLVRGNGETVLAVEDNASLRRVVARQLTELGYRVLEAEDAQTALRILESEAIDLLFTDIVMPGGTSGYEIAGRVLARWPQIKVVLTSGFPENRTKGDPTAHGLRLLSKPYRRDDLGRIIREALDS